MWAQLPAAKRQVEGREGSREGETRTVSSKSSCFLGKIRMWPPSSQGGPPAGGLLDPRARAAASECVPPSVPSASAGPGPAASSLHSSRCTGPTPRNPGETTGDGARLDIRLDTQPWPRGRRPEDGISPARPGAPALPSLWSLQGLVPSLSCGPFVPDPGAESCLETGGRALD